MRCSLIRTLSILMLTGAVLLFAGGCMKAGPPWPAITEPPTGVHTPGRWVWAELFTDNVDAAMKVRSLA